MKTVLIALALLVAPLAGTADVPSTLSFQGVLTDDAGALVPDGAYSFEFKIYDVATGGTALWSKAPGLFVEDGRFDVKLGTAFPIDLPFNKPYWLGVTVAPGAEIAPRIPLTATPYALSLRTPYADSISSASSAFSLGNASGSSILARGLLQVGSPTQTGEVNIKTPGVSVPLVHVGTTNDGGEISMADVNGDEVARIGADSFSGTTSGDMWIARAPGQTAFSVDGSTGSSHEPTVRIEGVTREAVFEMSVAGNGSVVLPVSSINALERVSEAGVASISQSGGSFLNNQTVALLTRSVLAPEAGYVLAIATGELISPKGTYGITMDAGLTLPATQDFTVSPGGTESRWPITIHGLFQVPAGITSFYFVGTTTSNLIASSLQLTLLWVPTAYGAVTPAAEPMEAPEGGWSVQDAALERDQAQVFHRERLLQELSVVDARRAQLEARMQRERIRAASAEEVRP